MLRLVKWFGRAAMLAAGLMLITPDFSQARPGRGGGGGRGYSGYNGGYRGGYGGGYNRGWGWGGIGLYGGYYPYYGGYGYYGYPTADYYYAPDTNYYSTPSYYYGQSVPSVTTVPTSQSAMVTVQVPDPNATVTINGAATASTGTVRQFQSPPLDASGNYSYEITATWMQNGQPMTRTQTVHVAPGGQSLVNFLQS